MSGSGHAGHGHAAVLSILLALFVFRVSVQLMQWLRPTPLLPPFEAWHSATLPYGILVAAQALIVLAVLVVIVRLWRGQLRPRRKLGAALIVLGAIYMLGAAFRLIAGMSFLSHLAFFHATLPSIFHMVLAATVLTLGHFHWHAGARET